MKMTYEPDNDHFDADAYSVDYYGGIAWYVLGWETESDEDTEWSGYMQRTGNVVAVMIGDNRRFSIDPEEIHPIKAEEYCSVCGQIGCHHNA